MRTFARIAAGVVLASTAFGQTAEKPATLESVDVHVSPPSALPGMAGGIPRDGRFEIRNATMVDLVRTAWNVDADKVVGGPNWLETDRFDVIATVPKNATVDTVRPMLKSLLADRFGLKVHEDNKPVPVYVLSLGKDRHKLKPSEGAGQGCKPVPPSAPPEPGTIPLQHAACSNLTSTQIGETLRQIAGGYVDRPVVDQTKLEGTWDFDIKWTKAIQGRPGPDGAAPAAVDPNGGITVFEAVEKQLGLKLEKGTNPVQVTVIDNLLEKPIE